MDETSFHKRGGFTLVEIMIVVAIIALLATIAVPAFLRARKRSQASRIINDLRLIDYAVDQYAIDNSKSTGDAVAVTDWTNYLKTNTHLYVTGNDILGNAYGDQVVDTLPKLSSSSYTALSDVAPDPFWLPYHSPLPAKSKLGHHLTSSLTVAPITSPEALD